MKKYRLKIAVHEGTLLSRDIVDHHHQYFWFKYNAMKKFKSDKARYNRIGYQIWYAYLKNLWTGKEILLESNSYER